MGPVAHATGRDISPSGLHYRRTCVEQRAPLGERGDNACFDSWLPSPPWGRRAGGEGFSFNKGGQDPIVHLQADLNACAQWASKNGIRFTFSNSHAGDRLIQERKQAEFLIFDSFPWPLVEHIGVFNQNIVALANEAIQLSSHRPTIQVENGWYF